GSEAAPVPAAPAPMAPARTRPRPIRARRSMRPLPATVSSGLSLFPRRRLEIPMPPSCLKWTPRPTPLIRFPEARMIVLCRRAVHTLKRPRAPQWPRFPRRCGFAFRTKPAMDHARFAKGGRSMPIEPGDVRTAADAQRIVEERRLDHVKLGVFDA